MNNSYRLLGAAFLFFGSLFFSQTVFGEKIITRENAENRMEIISSDYSGLEVLNIISRIHLDEVENAEGAVFTRLHINAYTKNLLTGHPLLPVRREMIEIPASANAEIKFLSISFRDYKLDDHGFGHPLFPLQPEQIKSEDYHEFVIDEAAYQQNKFNDEALVSVDELGYMRGTRIGRINIAPVQYNPVTNTIRVYDEIRFSIHFTGADIPATIEQKQKYYSPFFSSINRQLPNFQESGSRENFMRYPVKYVIVSDPMFENMLQPFVEWKTKKGFTVIEAYTDDPEVGSTTTSIKAYLEDLYNSGTTEDPAPSFVLFVGDIDQVPAFYGNTGSHVTDLFYCEYTGDYFPEVYYGRFSAEDSTDLQPQIDKTLQYEKYEMPDPSYLNEVVLVAGMDGSFAQDWGNGQINYGTENYFNADHGLTSQTYLYPESGSHSADIIQDVSDGVSYGNYSAHCGPGGWSDPSFNVSDIPTLENQDMYGLLVGNCCQSNSFNADVCFGEALLRAENKGALGYIGGSNNTMWDPDYYWGVGVGQITEDPPPYEETSLGAYDRMFHDHGEDFGEWYVTQDEMIFAGNLAVTEGTPGSAEYYWEIYHLMGDPSLMIYFSEPPVMTASYQDVIFIGLTTFEINTEPYAYVGLSMNGVLHGAGLADSLGNVSLQIEAFTEPGEADLVITGQNRAPLITTVNVAPPDGPYVIFNAYEINDENGNNNQQADYNENIILDVWLENVGNDDAEDVSAFISTSDTMITITGGTGDWGMIAASDTSLLESAYALDIHENITDQHVVQFDMLIENATREQWSSSFNMVLNAPRLVVAEFTVDDTLGGDGNGRLDPGEDADLIFLTRNAGHAMITGVEAILECEHEGIILQNTSVEIDTLQSSEEFAVTFSISVSEEIEIGSTIGFNYLAVSGYYQADMEAFTPVGLILEDWESAGFESFEWSFGGNKMWEICDEEPYEGSFCSRSGDIFDNQTTSMYVEYNVAMDDSISFYKKVSCEDDPNNDDYDYMAFYIDGEEMGRWDGIVEWSYESFPVSMGLHTFKWEYVKDYSVSAGDDCAWVDYIVFPAQTSIVGLEEIYNEDIAFNIYPVPARDQLNISFQLDKPENISLNLYNSLGQLQQRLLDVVRHDETQSKIQFDAGALPRGVYHLELTAGDHKFIRKIIIVH